MFLLLQVYLSGNPILFTITLPLLLHRRHCVFFLALLCALALHSHKLSLAYASQAPLAAHSNGKALQQETRRQLDY
jgi:hypothetical protein